MKPARRKISGRTDEIVLLVRTKAKTNVFRKINMGLSSDIVETSVWFFKSIVREQMNERKII